MHKSKSKIRIKKSYINVVKDKNLKIHKNVKDEKILSHLIKLDEDPLHINAANEAGRTALMVAVDR